MKLMLIVCFYVVACAASENAGNKPAALFLSSLEESSGFESLVSAKILNDCDLASKAHEKFETYQDVEVKKREINQGQYPLSRQVKIDIATMLDEHYALHKDAIKFLDNYAEKFSLHPASVEKIKEMMLHKKVDEFDYERETQRWINLTKYCASMHEVTDSSEY